MDGMGLRVARAVPALAIVDVAKGFKRFLSTERTFSSTSMNTAGSGFWEGALLDAERPRLGGPSEERESVCVCGKGPERRERIELI